MLLEKKSVKKPVSAAAALDADAAANAGVIVAEAAESQCVTQNVTL